jgi:alanine dehydrogenase
MIVGCVKEIKNNEFRVGMTPANAAEYIRHGHKVYVETGLGEGSGFPDDEYQKAGAILADVETVWGKSELLIKVKEPLEAEYKRMRPGQILFTYLHLAADRELTDALTAAKVKGVAYETLRDKKGQLPLLKPMSEIAGRLAAIEGAKCLEKPYGGRGVLISGVPGVRKAKVVVLGGGFVGTNACRMVVGLGADVTVIDLSIDRLVELDELFSGHIRTIFSTTQAIEEEISDADLVIGAVLIPGAAAPKLIRREHLKKMRPGSVIVDVAVDQGGCVETTRPTTHDDPTFVVDGVVHYCVANMPGAVPYTSTMALTNATLGYGLKIADFGLEEAARRDPAITSAINTYEGEITCQGVAEAFNLPCKTLKF